MDWRLKFQAGLTYDHFLEAYGTAQQRNRWRAVHEQVALDAGQRTLLEGFTRQMNILCLAGAWCGDCVNQCPILQRFSERTPRIQIRYLDRDAHAELQQALSLCGGQRVPVVVFLSEDFQECGRYGDRTLSKYRELACTLPGAACPTGTGDEGLLQSVTAEWLAEFERVQLMLRVSPRLRERHGD